MSNQNKTNREDFIENKIYNGPNKIDDRQARRRDQSGPKQQQRYREKSPGQQEFIERRKMLQMQKFRKIPQKKQRETLGSFKNGRTFQRRFRFHNNNNSNKKGFTKSPPPDDLLDKGDESMLLPTDETTNDDDGVENLEILEMEKELVAERERIKLLRLQAEADLKREEEDATRMAMSRQKSERRSRSPHRRDDVRRQSNIVENIRKTPPKRIRENQERQPEISNDDKLPRYTQISRSIKDKSARYKEKTPEKFHDQGYFKHSNKSPVIQSSRTLFHETNKHSFPLIESSHDRDNIDDLMSDSILPMEPLFHNISKNRRIDQHAAAASTESTSIDRNNQYRRLTNLNADEKSISNKTLNEEQFETKLLPLTPALYTGGGMFDKHIQRIQDEFDDRFGLRQQPQMKIDCGLLENRHDKQYIENREAIYIKKSLNDNDDMSYNQHKNNDDDGHFASPRKYSNDKRYTSRSQQNQYRNVNDEQIFHNDTTAAWDQEIKLQQNSNKTNESRLNNMEKYHYFPTDDLSRDRKSNVYTSNSNRDERQTVHKSRNTDINTFSTKSSNFRELTDVPYHERRSRSTDRNSHTNSFQKDNQRTNTFSRNENDESFFPTKKSSNDYYAQAADGSDVVGDSRLVEIVYRKSSTSILNSHQQVIETGKKLKSTDYNRSRYQKNIHDDDDDNKKVSSTDIQRCMRDQYSSGNNYRKPNEFMMNDRSTDARQYIIEKEMQKFNERSRSTASNNNGMADFVSKRINDRHNEKKILPSNWPVRNQNDFPTSTNKVQEFHHSSFNDNEHSNSYRTNRRDDKGHSNKFNQQRYDQPSTDEQRYNDKPSSSIKFGNNRPTIHDKNQRRGNLRYDPNEGKKNQVRNNAIKPNNDNRQPRFSFQKRNDCPGFVDNNNDRRMDAMYQKKNSHFGDKHWK